MNARGWTLWLGFAVLCALALGIVGRHLDRPGLYYDELIQVEPSIAFLRSEPARHLIPGATAVRFASRWFPVMTQPYMGALKSQLLIPFLAIFGESATSLRLTTLTWSLVGLLLMMLWARRALGLTAALIAGVLVVVDPSFLFVSRHDWGSFALGFACRCGALVLFARAWDSPRGGHRELVAGGVLVGLGIYNKIDFGVVVLFAGAALLCVRPGLLGEIARAPGRALRVAVGLALGAAPLLASLPSTLAVTRQALARPGTGGDFAEKWHTWTAMLDGSYFHELMLSGGQFETMFEADGARSLFPIAFALSLVWIAARARSGGSRARTFVGLCALGVPIGLFLMPRAIRIHHALLAMPFPQLAVAIAASDCWSASRRWVRGIGIVAVVALAASSLRVDLATMDTIVESRGKGRWSDAIGRFAGDLRAAERQQTAVALDWGLHLPLRFADRGLHLVEPIWQLDPQRRDQPWQFQGNADTVYLLLEPEFAVFRYGEQFLDAVGRVPADRVAIEHHADASGDPVFVSVRLLWPHRLGYTGQFQIR